ncbi:hypothetical protein ACFOSS_12685 [Pseudaeromonas sharmana]|uniref:Uncharacterized protein n=1 Tax=Pseudaeromonas sharmana TaxID=328412 RepID=A0ABV8CQC3_9GAMM
MDCKIEWKKLERLNLILVFSCAFTSPLSKASEILFNCNSGVLKYELIQDDAGRVFYVHKKNGIQDFSLSSTQKNNPFKVASVPFSGGGMAYVHFKNGEYDYYLYNAVSYASEPYIDVLGVMVWHENKIISNRHCSGSANGLFPPAFRVLSEEELDIKIQNEVFDNRD